MTDKLYNVTPFTMNSNSTCESVVAVAVVEPVLEDDDDQYDIYHEMPAKLLELSAAGYKDRSKRRLSLPISGSRKSSIASSDGTPGVGLDKGLGKGERRNSYRRDSNFSCSSWSDSYTEYDSDDDVGGVSPRDKEQKTSSGFSDFCVRNIEKSKLGRHEIDFAENEMEGLMKLREKVVK